MRNLLTVAHREFFYNLRRPAFIAAALGTPLFILLIFGVSILFAANGDSLDASQSVGYIDPAGIIAPELTPEEYADLFTPYPDEAAAQAALEGGDIQAYFVLPENRNAYLLTGGVELVTRDGQASDGLEEAIETVLLANVTDEVQTEVPLERLQSPPETTVEILNSGRVVSRGGFFVLLLFPMIFGILVVTASLTTSGFLMSGLVEERTNRIIEIIVTSVTPMQLLAGKILGLALLGLLQVGVLAATGLGALFVLQQTGTVTGFALPVDLVLLGIVYFLLAYFLMASLLAGVGAVVGSEQESRQYSGMFSLLFTLPYFFVGTFIEAPNSTLATVLSLIPFTAPTTMMLRSGFTTIPAWQITASIAIMLVTIVIVIFAASRIFRWGLLLYGKKFNLREIAAVVMGRREMGTTTPTSEVSA